MTKWIYCPECKTELTTNDYGPTCPDGHFTKYPTPVAATMAFIENNSEYLLIKRCHEPQKGMWDLPGGFVEYNESALEGLKREIKEETQLCELGEETFLGTFPSTYGGIEQCLTTAYTIISKNRDVVLSEENSEYKWINIKDIAETDLAFEDERDGLRLLKQRQHIT